MDEVDIMALEKRKAVLAAHDAMTRKVVIEAPANSTALDQAELFSTISKEPTKGIIASMVTTFEAALIDTHIPVVSSVDVPCNDPYFTY